MPENNLKVTNKQLTDFECRICKESFPFKVNLAKHIKICRKGKGSNSVIIAKPKLNLPQTQLTEFVCHVCKESFPVKLFLTKHLYIHHKEKSSIKSVKVPEKSKILKTMQTKTTKIQSIDQDCEDTDTVAENSLKITKEQLSEFECHICKESFPYKVHLSKHLRLCNKKNNNVQPKTTQLRKKISKIQKEVTSPSSEFKCHICDECFPSKLYLVKHKDLNHKDSSSDGLELTDRSLKITKKQLAEFECHICKESFPYKTFLSNHLQIHDQERSFSKKVINEPKKISQTVKNHAKSTEKRSSDFACNVCKKLFRDKTSLSEHQNLHHKDKDEVVAVPERNLKITERQLSDFECHICKESFPYKIFLSKHLRTHHKSKNKKGSVPKKEVQTKKTPPKMSNINSSNFKCQICNKSFQSKLSLSNHVKLHPKDSESDVAETPEKDLKVTKKQLADFECRICKESFPYKVFLLKHAKIHKKK